MSNFLNKDSFGDWSTLPPVSKEKIKNVNCHKFVLYIIGKISWDEMVFDDPVDSKDFTFGERARALSDPPFVLVKDLQSLLSLVNQTCEVGKEYIGQILDAETNEMAHSFIVRRESNDKYVCFDKPGFKYPFSIHDLEKILNFVNKDGEKSNQNQKWRFLSINDLTI